MSECVICDRCQPASFDHTVIFADEHWVVRHSRETNIQGYLVIEPRRHFLDLSKANSAECVSYGQVLSQAMNAIREVVDAERIYTFSLGESCPHYHLHVIPRRAGFPRAYKARGIMQYPLTPAVDESVLEFLCERLRRAFSRVKALT